MPGNQERINSTFAIHRFMFLRVFYQIRMMTAVKNVSGINSSVIIEQCRISLTLDYCICEAEECSTSVAKVCTNYHNALTNNYV